MKNWVQWVAESLKKHFESSGQLSKLQWVGIMYHVVCPLFSSRYEPSALGLEGSALDVVMAALRSWSGGLLVATEQATQNGTWERWTLAQSELDSLSHPELQGEPVKEFAVGEAC